MPEPAEKPGALERLPGWARTPVELVLATFDRFFADDVPRLAAAMSYFLLLALAPALLIVNAALGVVGARVGADLQPDKVAGATSAAASGIQEAVSWAGSYAPYVAVALVLFGAVGVFGQFIGALEKIWSLPQERTPIRAFLRYQAWSLGLLGIATLALLVALTVAALLALFGSLAIAYAQSVGIEVPGVAFSTTLRFVVIYLISAVLFAVAFTVSPDRGTRWRDALPGSLVTAVLFTIGDMALSVYLSSTDRFNVFGTFQFFVVLIVWIYYAAIVALWGAELTRLLILRAEERRAAQPAR